RVRKIGRDYVARAGRSAGRGVDVRHLTRNSGNLPRASVILDEAVLLVVVADEDVADLRSVFVALQIVGSVGLRKRPCGKSSHVGFSRLGGKKGSPARTGLTRWLMLRRSRCPV